MGQWVHPAFIVDRNAGELSAVVDGQLQSNTGAPYFGQGAPILTRASIDVIATSGMVPATSIGMLAGEVVVMTSKARAYSAYVPLLQPQTLSPICGEPGKKKITQKLCESARSIRLATPAARRGAAASATPLHPASGGREQVACGP